MYHSQMNNMPHLPCRGEEERKRIVENYNLSQIAFNRLVNGDNFPSDAGGKDIIDRYYMFEAKNKQNPTDVYAIICGTPTGQSFLQLLHIESMPLFDPLSSQSDGNLIGHIKKYPNHRSKQWNPVMYQLYNATCLIPICWEKVISDGLLEIKKNCLNYCYSEPYCRRIKPVNNIIQQDSKGRTLTEMINEELLPNNDIRIFKLLKVI
jgi:hypothetical protein